MHCFQSSVPSMHLIDPKAHAIDYERDQNPSLLYKRVGPKMMMHIFRLVPKAPHTLEVDIWVYLSLPGVGSHRLDHEQ